MGLEPFEVGFFVREKFTKLELALKGVLRSRSKLFYRLLVMFPNDMLEESFFVKSLMGTLLD